MSTMSPLVKAIREKFPDLRSAIRKLGLDESLADSVEGTLLRKNPKRFVDFCVKQFGSEGAVLSRLGMDAAPFLTEPEPIMKSDPRGGTGGEIEGGTFRRGEDKFGLRRHADDDLHEKVETMPAENLSEDEFSPEEEQSLREYAEDMHRQGKDRRVIDDAMRMARDFLRRHRHHADDVMPRRVDVQDRARDKMPLNHFDGGRAIVDHGLDTINGNRELMNNIGHEPEVRNADRMPYDRHRRYGMDTKHGMTERQKADLHRLIPGLSLVGDMWGDGPGLAGHKNPYEV